MDAIAALVPPLVVAGAFIAIVRAVLRGTDGRSAGANRDDPEETPPDRGTG